MICPKQGDRRVAARLITLRREYLGVDWCESDFITESYIHANFNPTRKSRYGGGQELEDNAEPRNCTFGTLTWVLSCDIKVFTEKRRSCVMCQDIQSDSSL